MQTDNPLAYPTPRIGFGVRAKGSFDQRGFDEALVSHGFVPVKHLPALVVGQ